MRRDVVLVPREVPTYEALRSLKVTVSHSHSGVRHEDMSMSLSDILSILANLERVSPRGKPASPCAERLKRRMEPPSRTKGYTEEPQLLHAVPNRQHQVYQADQTLMLLLQPRSISSNRVETIFINCPVSRLS